MRSNTRRGPGRPPKLEITDLDSVVVATAEALLDELAATRRLGRVAPAGPLRRALLATRLAESLDAIAAREVRRARAEHGVHWREVGAAFGVTGQTAQVRFGGRARSELDT